MKTYDWIIIGAGLTGVAVSYELAKKGFSVLLLEKNVKLDSATRYSYGGISYWSGSTELTRQLCQEGIERHRILSAELGTDTQFRELDLLLTISAGNDPEKITPLFSKCSILPRLIDVKEAKEMEPLLNPEAIAAALTIRHAHVSPEAILQAYQQAFLKCGGEIKIASVERIIKEGNRISGVATVTSEIYHADQVLICAGGYSRALLKTAGIAVKLYFSHAEMIEIPPVDVHLRTLVMPAEMARLELEKQFQRADIENTSEQSSEELVPSILEPGAIPFHDGSLRIGQISRFLSTTQSKIDAADSEMQIRAQVGKILPALANLPGTWHHCLVAFTSDHLPLIGKFTDVEGIQIFSGFSAPFVFVPSIAQRFANFVAGEDDHIIPHLSPLR